MKTTKLCLSNPYKDKYINQAKRLMKTDFLIFSEE